jgi:hypothetical protein
VEIFFLPENHPTQIELHADVTARFHSTVITGLETRLDPPNGSVKG